MKQKLLYLPHDYWTLGDADTTMDLTEDNENLRKLIDDGWKISHISASTFTYHRNISSTEPCCYIVLEKED